jgi:ankyrin repeat protein
MLYRYIWEGDTVGIQKLLDRGASLVKPLRVGLKYPFAEAERKPPLYSAGRASTAMFLIRHGARLDNPFHLPLNPEEYVLRLESLPFLNYAEKRLGVKLTLPNNPIFAVLSDTVMMQGLMKRGVSINSVDSYGNTALIYAKHWDPNVPLEKFLLRHGADKDIVNKRGGSYLIGRERRYRQ